MSDEIFGTGRMPALDPAVQSEKQLKYEADRSLRRGLMAQAEQRRRERVAMEEAYPTAKMDTPPTPMMVSPDIAAMLEKAHAEVAESLATVPDPEIDLTTIGCTTPEQCMANGCSAACAAEPVAAYLDRVDALERADPIVEKVVARMRERSAVGQAKYGTTLARTDLGMLDWLKHAQEEAMDWICYLERVRVMLVGEES